MTCPEILTKVWLALGIFLLGIGPAPATAQRVTADLVLRNGRIFTGDPARPWGEAVAIRGDRIVAVGSDADIAKMTGPRTHVIDLGGRMAMPGINDAHDHVGDAPLGVEAKTKRSPMADPGRAELAEAVAEAARQAPPGAWISLEAGPRSMADTSQMLAAIKPMAGNHPVLARAWWGHGVILNPRGLQTVGLNDTAKDPPGGHYERDAFGHLTGKLEEYAGWRVLRTLYSKVGTPVIAARLHEYAKRRLAEGVTSVQVIAGYGEGQQFVSAFKAADMNMRVRLIPQVMPGTANDDGMSVWRKVNPAPAALLRVSGIKWVLDGTPMEELAFTTTPYRNRPGWHGRLNFGPAHLDAQLRAALRAKQQYLFHAVGDATAELVVADMEKLAPARRWRPLRLRIEHGNGLVGTRLERAARLGIVIAQPRPTSPIRAWLATGVTVAYGSDSGFPPFSAFAQMTAPDNPNSVTREQALGILTKGSAYAEFQEKEKGMVKPGMLADIVVLSQDVTTAPTSMLSATHSLLTIVGGKIVYSSPEFNRSR